MRTRDQTISGVYDTYSGSSGRRPNKSLHSLSHCSQQYQRRPGTSRLSRTSTTTKASRRSVWPSTYPSVGLWNRGYQNFIWKNKSVAVYERRRKHGTMAGGGGNGEGKQHSHTHCVSPSNLPGTALYGLLVARDAYT